MTREIKFRAWDVMIQDYLYPASINSYTLTALNNPRYELMQYTGLKDKDGVEIYEGDIVSEWWRKTADPEVNSIVYYKNGFYLNDGLHSNWDAEDCEVIGNIYENGDLLK